MADIKRTVSIAYQATGLEDIKKSVAEIEVFTGETDNIKEIKKEMKELQVLLDAWVQIKKQIQTAWKKGGQK